MMIRSSEQEFFLKFYVMLLRRRGGDGVWTKLSTQSWKRNRLKSWEWISWQQGWAGLILLWVPWHIPFYYFYYIGKYFMVGQPACYIVALPWHTSQSYQHSIGELWSRDHRNQNNNAQGLSCPVIIIKKKLYNIQQVKLIFRMRLGRLSRPQYCTNWNKQVHTHKKWLGERFAFSSYLAVDFSPSRFVCAIQ